MRTIDQCGRPSGDVVPVRRARMASHLVRRRPSEARRTPAARHLPFASRRRSRPFGRRPGSRLERLAHLLDRLVGRCRFAADRRLPAASSSGRSAHAVRTAPACLFNRRLAVARPAIGLKNRKDRRAYGRRGSSSPAAGSAKAAPSSGRRRGRDAARSPRFRNRQAASPGRSWFV